MPTYKEQQILDKVCKVTQQKQIKYYDFILFFDFQYEKIIFNCQPSHFSPCSAVPGPGSSCLPCLLGWNPSLSSLNSTFYLLLTEVSVQGAPVSLACLVGIPVYLVLIVRFIYY